MASEQMTMNVDITRLQELLDKATPGPWEVSGVRNRGPIVLGQNTRMHMFGPDRDCVGGVYFDMKTGIGWADVQLIAESRNTLPDLLVALKAERTARLAVEAEIGSLAAHRDLEATYKRLARTRAEAAEAAVAAKDAEIARLRHALAWYADPERYRLNPQGNAFDRRDTSYVARAALEDTP